MAGSASQSRLPRALRPFAARPRLLAGFFVGLAVFALATPWIARPATRSLVAWDAGVLVFLLLAMQSMVDADHERMRRRAEEHDEGRHFILILAIGAAIASIVALVAELATAKGQTGGKEMLQVALSAATIALSWAFVQFIFALHYAHVFYSTEGGGTGHKQGLVFPDDDPPDYWDFLHFAIIIGATAQTADITIVSKELRRVGTVHSLIAFAFNTAILALMINVASGLL
ncbi:MAG TPA: DUF1345 domain-containing protein [Caulobacteraceae bacterium]|nr:DUF1345 domain-containing protein [Caulobacteraceae bacterium]